MRKFILTIMTLLCTFALAMGTLAACGVYPSSPSVNLEITGKPDGNVITLTSEVNTLALGCNQTGVTWSSSDTSVATVNDGVVTLHSVGSTTITVTKGDKTDSFVLVVVREQNASSETVTVEGFPQNGEVSFASRTLQLSATCSDGSEIEWISENESVATVDQTGKVTFLSLGSVDIVAQKKGDARVYAAHTLEIVMPNATSEDFSNAEIVGDYVVGNTAIRFGKALSPEIVQEGNNYYLKYSRPKTDASYIYEDNYAVFSFGGLEKGARYVLKYKMKVLSCDGSYDHQINVYSDYGVPVDPRAPQIGNVYSFSLTGLDSNKGKVYQTGSEALYRDGVRWSRADSSTDDFHEYTLGFIAGESTVGFGFVSMTHYEVQYDYIRVDKAPELENFKLSARTTLQQGETYQIEAVAADETELYYQPLQLTYQSSDTSVATVDEYGMVTGIAPGTVTITATRTGESGTVEKTIDIKVIPEIDKASYDIFYEDGDINEWGYAIKDPFKLPEGTQFEGVKKDDSYRVTLEIDAISYTGTNVQFYLAVRNDTAGDPGVINHTGWIKFPVASGEKQTIEYELDAKLAADLNATQLAVYVCNVTNCLIGVKVVSVELLVSPYDSLIKTSDIAPNGYATQKDPIVLSSDMQKQITDKTGTYKVTLEIDAKSYTSNQANGKIGWYVALMTNTDGDSGVIGHTGWVEFPVTSGTTQTVEVAIDANLLENVTLTRLAVYVCNVTACKIGVNVVSVELLDSNYDSLIKTSDIAPNGYATGKDPIVLSEAKQGKRWDEYKVTLDIDAKSYTSNQANGKIGLYVAVMNEQNGVIGHTGWIEFPVAAGERATKEYTLIAEGNVDVTDWTVSKVAVYVCNVTNCLIGVNVKNVELVSKDRDLVIKATGLAGNEYLTWPAPIVLSSDMQKQITDKTGTYKVTLKIDATYTPGPDGIGWYVALMTNTNGDSGVIGHTGWVDFTVPSGTTQTVEVTIDANLLENVTLTRLAVYVRNVTNCLISVKVVSVELLYDSLIQNSDIDSNGYATGKDPIVLSEAKQGKRWDEYKVTLDIDAKSYTSNQANGKIGLYVAVMNATNGVIGHTGWIEFPVAAGEKATKEYTLIADCDVTDWTVSKVAVYVCNVTACEIGVNVKNVELVSKDRDLVIKATGLAGNEYLTWPAPIVLSSDMQKQITDKTGTYKVTLKIDATYTPGPDGIGWYVALMTNTDGDSGVIGHTGWVDFTVPSGTTQTVEVVIDANLLENVTLTRLAVYVRFVKDCSISVKVVSVELLDSNYDSLIKNSDIDSNGYAIKDPIVLSSDMQKQITDKTGTYKVTLEIDAKYYTSNQANGKINWYVALMTNTDGNPGVIGHTGWVEFPVTSGTTQTVEVAIDANLLENVTLTGLAVYVCNVTNCLIGVKVASIELVTKN